MYRLLIADDEPKIRRRIAEMLDWGSLGIEIAAFAENGRRALEIVGESEIDLCVVDISMPYLSGLDFIEQASALRPELMCIVVTGHDEFGYAQRSVNLHVFDYLLKPLKTEAFSRCVARCVDAMNMRAQLRRQREQAMELVRQRLPELRRGFLRELIGGVLSSEEIQIQRALLDLDGHPAFDAFFLPSDKSALDVARTDAGGDRMLGEMTRDALSKLLRQDAVVTFDSSENLIALQPAAGAPDEQLGARIEALLRDAMKWTPRPLHHARVESLEALPALYADWLEAQQTHLSPMIQQVLRYIDTHFQDSALSLSALTREFHVSAGYLSRLIRQETGMTFIEYLIRVRIQHAVRLLDVTELRIYEIADQVGYSSQHYFCSAFKRVLGIAPSEYRAKGGNRHVTT